jgi:hypothetical protein
MSVFLPPRWSPPSTLSTPTVTKLDGPKDWGRIADLERERHGDRLVWISRQSVSAGETGPVMYHYNVITRHP